MTTARERALENAKARFFDSARTVNPTPAQEHVCRVAVYEASDVWEPLLRRYGVHEEGCERILLSTRPCTCGLSEALGES